MIQANELRLKNLFRDKLTGSLLSVCALDEDDERVDFRVVDRSKYPLPEGWQAEPVPLTAEILQKCGFEKKQFVYQDGGTAEAFVNGRFVIRYIDEVKGYCCEWFPYPQSQNVLPGTMNYLHQLQNNYFWWTDGTELTVNLEQVKV